MLAELRSRLHRDDVPRPSGGRLLLELVTAAKFCFCEAYLVTAKCVLREDILYCIHKY
jgi:hypothetical protein